MRFAYIIAIVLFLLSPGILSARCQAPTVRDVGPVPHSLAVPATTEIAVTFDNAVDPAVFEQRGFGVFGRWSGVVTGTFRWDAGHTRVRFRPSKPFMAGEHVTVSLNRMTVAEGGEPLAAGYAWGFWVATGPGSLDVVQTGRLPVRRSGEGWVQAYGAYAGDLDGDGYGSGPGPLPTDTPILPFPTSVPTMSASS